MNHVDIRAAFPMHSWEEFWITKKLTSDPRSEGYRGRIHAVLYNGQRFALEE